MGFDWPKYALVDKQTVIVEGRIDLQTMLESLELTRAFYRRQLNQAYKFKQQTGADYADFTDRRDEYARMYHAAETAIKYLEAIIAALNDEVDGDG